MLLYVYKNSKIPIEKLTEDGKEEDNSEEAA